MARRVEFEFDPFEIAGVDKSQLPATVVRQVLDDVGEYVVNSVLEDTANQRSAVDGSKFQKLSPEYKKKKVALGGSPVPNLELSTDMLSSLKVIKRGSNLTLTVGASEQDKADGHNNHSGDSRIPTRRFIPLAEEDGGFRPAITKGIQDIVEIAFEDFKQNSSESTGTVTKYSIEDILEKGLTVKLKGFLD